MKLTTQMTRRATTLGALLLSTLAAHAQSATTDTNTSPAGSPDDQTVVLSPFEVSASNNAGYQATDTLAGSRVRTELRDLGSSIEVVTQQFLKDTGATSNQQLLLYTTNTEVGGPGGNFGGLGDGSSLSDNNQRLNPNATTRVRGLDSADNTRNFFLTDIPWDSYNTNRIDIQRGANSILFGNGSGAGIINGNLDEATIGDNTADVQGRYGKYGSYRGTLNFDYDLIPGQLALRFADLYDKTYYQQDPAYSLDRREYGAVRFDPKFLQRGGAHTSIKISYENGDITANRPRTTPPVDEISPWWRTTPQQMVSPTPVNSSGTTLLGTINPLISHAGYDPFVMGISASSAPSVNTLIAANPGRQDIGSTAASNVDSEPWLYAGTGNFVNGDWQGGLGAIYANPASGQLSYYLGSGTLGTPYGLSSTGATDKTVAGLRAPALTGLVGLGNYASAAGFLYQASGVYRNTTITDPSIFDFYNKLLDGPNKNEFQRFHTFNVSIDQTFFNDKLGFQFAYDSQNYTQGQNNQLGGTPTLMLDVWKYLPVATFDATTGALTPVLNPNFGRPFIASGQGIFQTATTGRKVARLTPYADLDFKDILKSDNLLTKILGRHQITGLLESNKVTQTSASGPVNYLPQDAASTLLGASQPGTIGGTANKIVVVSYLGPSLINNSTLAGANISNITAVQQSATAPAWYFNSTYSATAPAPSTPWPGGANGSLYQPTLSATQLFQSENPANYVGWSTKTPVNVENVNQDGLEATNATARRDETQSWAVVDQWTFLDHTSVITAGLRKDKIDSFIPGANASGNRPLNAYGVVDYSQPFDYPTTASSSYTSALLKTYSIVLHTPDFINRHLPWDLNASVFFDHSDNFRPANRVDINGNPLAPPHGTTKDYGFMIEALKGRLSLKIDHFETKVFGADLGDTQGNNLRNRIGDELRNTIQFAYDVQNHVSGAGYKQTDPFDPTGLYAYTPAAHTDGSPITQADWVSAETAAQADATAALAGSLNQTSVLKAYGIDPTKWSVTNFSLPENYPTGLTITGDTISTGNEAELYLRPTDNWNIAFNAAHTKAKRTDIASAVSAFILSREAFLSSTPAGQLIWFGGGAGANSDGIARYNRNAFLLYSQFAAQEDDDVAELRPWAFNATTTYTIAHGPLKGVFFGGGDRWQDRSVIGYGVSEVSPFVSASSPAIGRLDPNKPFYGPADNHVDLWVGYNRKVFKNKVDWRLQLNVTNVGERAHLVPLNTNPDGSIASYSIADGAGWTLTSDFKF